MTLTDRERDLLRDLDEADCLVMRLVETLETIAAIGEGTATANSLPDIARLAREAIGTAKDW